MFGIGVDKLSRVEKMAYKIKDIRKYPPLPKTLIYKGYSGSILVLLLIGKRGTRRKAGTCCSFESIFFHFFQISPALTLVTCFILCYFLLSEIPCSLSYAELWESCLH